MRQLLFSLVLCLGEVLVIKIDFYPYELLQLHASVNWNLLWVITI